MDKRNDDRITAIEREMAIRDAKEQTVRTICITATTTALGFFYWLGSLLYSNSKAVMAAVKAFWLTSGHGE